MKHQENIKHLVILASPYSTLLTIAGPLGIFARTIMMVKERDVPFIYRTHVFSIDGKKKLLLHQEYLLWLKEVTKK